MVLEDENVDAAVAAFVPPLGIRQVDVAQSIVQAKHAYPDKPLLAVLMGRDGLPEGKAQLHEAGVPAYIFPESAARALAAMYRYRKWLDRPDPAPTRFEVDAQRVAGILDVALAEGREGLTEPEALDVLDAYGIPTVDHELVQSEDEAVAAALEMGGPVVLKVVSPQVVHKSDVGGVRIDLRDADQVRNGYRSIMESVLGAHPDADIHGILVTRFLEKGRETILGMSLDPSFGPLLMFGLGGIYVEALKDVSFRVQPVSREDAREMVEGIRGRKLLDGLRGDPPVDKEALMEALQRISQLVGEHHRISELDVNPFLAFAEGGVAVDARIRVRSPFS
jgi:acyl-CoA synthetase (NDP forming)